MFLHVDRPSSTEISSQKSVILGNLEANIGQTTQTRF